MTRRPSGFLIDRPSFSIAAPVADRLFTLAFGAPLAFGAGVLQGSTLARRLGISRWVQPRTPLGYLNPFRTAGIATGGLLYGTAIALVQGAYAIGGTAAALARPMARATGRVGPSMLQALRRMVFSADKRGRVFENLWTGLRIRPGLAMAAELAVMGGAAIGLAGTASMLPPARVEMGEAPFLLQDARPTAFDALEQAYLPFALHNLRHG